MGWGGWHGNLLRLPRTRGSGAVNELVGVKWVLGVYECRDVEGDLNSFGYCGAQNLVAELAVARPLFTCFVSELGRGFAHKSLTLPSSIHIPEHSHFPPQYQENSAGVLFVVLMLHLSVLRILFCLP